MRMLIFVLLLLTPLAVPVCRADQILEAPEDVTVLSGDPASLTCRVSAGPVSWYKDGLKIELSPGHSTDSVILPDGSLFFLTTRSQDTGLYHCQTRDGQISYPAALIVGTEEEGIIPSLAVEKTETAALPQTEIHQPEHTETLLRSVEVVEDQEVPSSVYIISMIVVALLTILIIIGAALVFSRIKRVNSGLAGGDGGDRESRAPMMYAVPREIIKQPAPHYNYILTNEYDTPINFVSSEVYNCVNNTYERGSPFSPSSASSPSSSNHYASSKILMAGSHNPGSVKKYKAGPGDGRYPHNYFAC